MSAAAEVAPVEVAPVAFYDEMLRIIDDLQHSSYDAIRDAVLTHIGVGITNGVAWIQTNRSGGLRKPLRVALAHRWSELMHEHALIARRGEVLMY